MCARRALDEMQLEAITGGTVITTDQGLVGFSSTGEILQLSDACPNWRDATNFVDDLLENNPGMSNADFDELAKAKLIELGWLDEQF